MSSTESIEPSHANSVEQDSLDISIYLTMRIESQSIEIDNLKKENEMKSIKISQLEDSLKQAAKGIGEHVARIFYLEIKLKENQSSFQSVETVTQQIKLEPSSSKDRINVSGSNEYFAEAVDYYQKIIRLDPTDALPKSITNSIRSLAYNDLAFIYDDLKDYKNAIACFDQAISYSPDDQNYYNKGELLRNLKSYGEALKCLDRAIQLKNLRYADIYAAKGDCLTELGNFDDALVCFDEAVKLNPNSSTIYFNKAELLKQLGKYKKSLKIFNQGIDLNKKDHVAFRSRALVQAELKNFDAAFADFEKAIILKEDYAEAYIEFAHLKHHSSHAFDEALKLYNKALAIEPKNESIYDNKGRLLVHMGDFVTAIECFSKAIELKPDEPIYYYNIGQTLLDNKEFRKSIEYLNDYVSKSKNPDATSYYYIGLAYTGLEEYEIALEYFDDALRIKPGDEKFLKDRNSCAKQIRKESETNDSDSNKKKKFCKYFQ